MIIRPRSLVVADQYANSFNWTLDTGAHPIATPPSLTGLGVILTLGQSNMAQYTNYTPSAPAHASSMYQFLYGDGTLRQWVEPLFGPPSPPLLGSFFGELAEALITGSSFTKVMMCHTALGGTSASEWGPGGHYNSIIVAAFKRLRAAGWPISAVIVGQGENETFYGLTGADWSVPWQRTIDWSRNFGYTGPWFFAKQTYNNGSINSSVQAAQVAIANGYNVLVGPDCDAFTTSYRYDNVHWNATGGAAVAAAWATVLNAYF